MLKAKITKEEINLLPVVIFNGKITLVDELAKVDQAIKELRESTIVGLDTETKPSFTRGTHHKVSLLQISTLDHCFLFRLNRIDFPPALADFLADSSIQKIGLSLNDDLTALKKRHMFKPEGFVDIQAIAKNYGIMDLSLQKIYAILFDLKISKSQRLTNWESPELSEPQLRYAATDAWASLQIFLKLNTLKKLSKKAVENLVLESLREQQAQSLKNRPETPTKTE